MAVMDMGGAVLQQGSALPVGATNYSFAPQTTSTLPTNYQEARNAFDQQQATANPMGQMRATVVGNDQFGQQFGYAADADAFNTFYNQNYNNQVSPAMSIGADGTTTPNGQTPIQGMTLPFNASTAGGGLSSLASSNMAPTQNYVTPPNLGTAGSPSGGSLTQGSALPNITTTQSQATAAPSWYTDYLSNLAQKGTEAGANAQYIGATPLQEQAFQQTAQNVGNYQPSLQAATNLAQQAGNTNVAQSVNQFMNPYTQQVVGALGDVGRRNIEQYLAPGATSAAVGSGQFGSKRGAEVLGQAMNQGLQNLNLEQSKALQTGYGQSLQAAQNQVANQLAGSQQLQNLATSTQGLGLGDVNALSTMGGQQQTIAQNQQLFPLQTAAQQAALLRGYTMPTSVSSTYTGPIPGAYSSSPLSQIAGVGSLLGALNTTNASGGKTPAQNLYAGLYGVGSDIYKSLTGTKGPADFATSQDYMNYIGATGGDAFDPALSDSAYLNDLYGLDIF
jgi:hypothetical protein